MVKPKITADEQNTRLVLRFTCALAVFSQYLEKNPLTLQDLLHPVMATFLRGQAPGFERDKLSDFEVRLLNLWAKFGGNGDAPRAHCDELLTCLELTLAQYHSANLDYLGGIREWLTDVERIEMLHLATTRSPGPVFRRSLLQALYAEGGPPSPAKLDRLPTNAISAPSSQLSASTPIVNLTLTQQRVADQLLRLGRLFFDEGRPHLSIKPRLCPLVVGPTGAGKGHVLAYVAKELGCPTFHVTFGDWVVTGAAGQYTPTLWSIVERFLTTKRLIVVLDEIDKFDANVHKSDLSAWSRSACNELWSLLDGRLPIEEFLRTKRNDDVDTESLHEILLSETKKGLWIVGIGTWQHIHKPPPRKLGFQTGRDDTQPSIADRLAVSAAIAPELLYRFNPTPIPLDYPTPEELDALLEKTGVLSLARQRGVAVDTRTLDLRRGGMRILEDLVTKILLAA